MDKESSKAIHAIGRRKTSVARVYLSRGKGEWDINGRALNDYFSRSSHVQLVEQPFAATETLGQYRVKVNVQGGGQTGQAGAIRLAVARALVSVDESVRTSLRKLGLLTRDPRMVERKKYGRPKARKRFQFSKR
ncbi:MAG: 30S ribosomal protein S9 [Candidatus Glassbacteria bacterium GWA2_58_10]|uniref:Small ribosomal subunit protein uS9 n=1 Tax=Candidatus Glassbacteria bacterium GWA2_58_10 TaxID=1817865 RepID=A0A1F5YDZ9_9BACT|nr:MAG: 30S ribosomal protein S9 [Candidatus Glassbacteria bacterium GWA2_58_10]